MSDHPWAALGPRPVLLDAALATGLFARGLATDVAPEAWNLARPDVVLDVHRSHVAAGAQVLHTNTFGALDPVLRAAGLARDADEITAAAVRLAREAADAAGRPVRVTGALGPSRLGTGEGDAAGRAFAAAARRLENAGVDALALETMMSRAEAVRALEAVRGGTSLPVSVALTIRPGPGGWVTPAGDDALAAAAALADAGADAVGFQCSTGPADVAEAAVRLLEAVSTPVLVKPNAGSPEEPPAAFCDILEPVLGHGRLSAVGGCCGTGEAHLRAIRDRIRALRC